MEFINPKKNFNEYLWMGIVDDNVDPKRRGRVKVRVQSLFDDLATADIPWAFPYNTLAGKSFGIPAVGKIVSVIFYNDNIYQPYYVFSENYNINLSNFLKNMSDDEYKNFFAILFDDRTQIYANDTNLSFDYKLNKITISNTDINLELKNNSQMLNLGTKDATQQAVLGNHWFDWMDKFVNTLLQPTSMLGNLGAPVLKPQLDQVLSEYLSIKNTFISNHVKVVDNDKVSTLKRPIKTDTSQNDRFTTVDEGGGKKPLMESSIVPEEVKQTIVETNNKATEEAKKASSTEILEVYVYDEASGEWVFKTYKKKNN